MEGSPMHMSNESLVVILVVGIVAGWLAGQIVRGAGFGLVGDLILGILGAFIGAWLLPQLGIQIGRWHHPGYHQRDHWRSGAPSSDQTCARTSIMGVGLQ